MRSLRIGGINQKQIQLVEAWSSPLWLPLDGDQVIGAATAQRRTERAGRPVVDAKGGASPSAQARSRGGNTLGHAYGSLRFMSIH
jgi:hypothetical protein